MQITHDPRFTHWIEQESAGGEKGTGQYWFTNADDAKDYAVRLNAIKPRWAFTVYERNPQRHEVGQPVGLVVA